MRVCLCDWYQVGGADRASSWLPGCETWSEARTTRLDWPAVCWNTEKSLAWMLHNRCAHVMRGYLQFARVDTRTAGSDGGGGCSRLHGGEDEHTYTVRVFYFSWHRLKTWLQAHTDEGGLLTSTKHTGQVYTSARSTPACVWWAPAKHAQTQRHTC